MVDKEQPLPSDQFGEREAVAPSLKHRFNEWIDQRTDTGIARYGEPLHTNNGRSAERDAFEEIIDFCQYQEQSRLELKSERDKLLSALINCVEVAIAPQGGG